MTSSQDAITVALNNQVGGHAGVLTTEDGSLLIKPALPLELKFYESLNTDEGFSALRPFVPNFIGTLKLEGQVGTAQPADVAKVEAALAAVANQKDEYSIVLENLSHPFSKPNIIDIKLGTVLYDESASPEKVARMEKTAHETTSFESGIRLTGFQVYDNVTSKPVNTPKSYGKSIKVSDLPDGIARFFCVGEVPTKEESSSSISSSSGLPKSLLLPILRAVRREISEIRQACSSIHMRMVGASLLVIYEADWTKCEEGLKRLAVEEDEDEDEDEEEDSDEASVPDRPGPPYVVKLIDFAHTRIVAGQGPDEGVLLGMDTVLKLLDDRIAEL